MKLFALAPLIVAVLSANAGAASYSTGFTSATGPEIDGFDGWIDSETTNHNLSFLVNWNGSNAAAYGGLFDVPISSTVGLTHAYGEALGITSAAFNFTIVDSNNLFPNRDVFSFSFKSSGSNLFSIIFTPVVPNPADPAADPNAQWNLSYQAGAGPTVSLSAGILEGGTYSMNLLLSANGSSTDFGLTISGGSVENRIGTIPVNPSSIASDFGVFWTPSAGAANAGSNYFLIDNVAVIPEASSALLGLLGASVGLIRRRRA